MSKNIKGLVLITGTTSGVGLNTLKPLLRFGWEVIAVNRSNKRAIKIAEEFLTKEEVENVHFIEIDLSNLNNCLLYTSPSPRDRQKSRMPSSA